MSDETVEIVKAAIAVFDLDAASRHYERELEKAARAARAAIAAMPMPTSYQIDRYGVALMMIREGCSDPAGLARRILAEFAK